MYRWFLAAALTLGVVSGMVEHGTFAMFAASSNDSTAFTSGTVTLSAAVTSGSLTQTSPALTPGQSFTTQVTIQNTGNLTLRYALATIATSSSTTPELSDTLELTVRPGSCPNSNTALYSGAVAGSAGKVFGDAATGHQSGDRQLTPAASEDLCLTILLPSGANAVLANTSTTVTYRFSAEQVAGTSP